MPGNLNCMQEEVDGSGDPQAARGGEYSQVHSPSSTPTPLPKKGKMRRATDGVFWICEWYGNKRMKTLSQTKSQIHENIQLAMSRAKSLQSCQTPLNMGFSS